MPYWISVPERVQRFVVLNGRDKAQLQYAEARLRAYLYVGIPIMARR
jgi:hypothetical protein